MSGEYVFDTEAIVAYLYKEPGHGTVVALLEDVSIREADGVLAETNACEVFSSFLLEMNANKQPLSAGSALN